MCKEEFFQSINENTFFGYQFCKMLYGYSLYDPPFLDAVLEKFRSYDRGAVESIYSCYLYCELRAEREMLKPIGREIAQKIDKEYEKKVKEWQKTIGNMTKPELTELCKQYLKEGIISRPEQFAMVVGLDQ